MFSVTNTGTCRRPSWTPKFSPTISGIIMESRDQVRMTVASPDSPNPVDLFEQFGVDVRPFFDRT